MTKTILVFRILRTATELRPVVTARMSRAEVRVDLLPIHLPSAMLSPAPLHLTRAVVQHMLVGGDSLVEEQTSLALHDRASERDRLARCAGPFSGGSVAEVGMQRVHGLVDRVKPAVVDDMSLVIVCKDGVRGVGGLAVAVVRVVLLVVGCDILPAVDWVVIVMEVVLNLCSTIGSKKRWNGGHLLHQRLLIDHWRLVRPMSRRRLPLVGSL